MKQKIPTLNFMVAGHADSGKTEIVKSLVHSLSIQRVLTPLKGAFTPDADPNASNATLNAESEYAWSNCFDVRINSTDRAFVSFIDFPGRMMMFISFLGVLWIMHFINIILLTRVHGGFNDFRD